MVQASAQGITRYVGGVVTDSPRVIKVHLSRHGAVLQIVVPVPFGLFQSQGVVQAIVELEVILDAPQGIAVAFEPAQIIVFVLVAVIRVRVEASPDLVEPSVLDATRVIFLETIAVDAVLNRRFGLEGTFAELTVEAGASRQMQIIVVAYRGLSAKVHVCFSFISLRCVNLKGNEKKSLEKMRAFLKFKIRYSSFTSYA